MGWKGFFYKAFEWLIFQFAFDHYTCSSLYTMNSLRLHFGISDEKLTTTYAGIDYNLWDPTTVSTQTTDALKAKYNLQNSFIGLYFGRPGVAKGLSDFLRAVPLISENIPHFKAFLIVPKGEKSSSGGIKSTVSNDEVTQLIDRLGIQEHVIWIDGIPYNQLKEYVMMADVVVLPTLAEGFGLAIAEVCAL
ncbi:glycosyltransferase family 4 protein [Patescibacteria group bacterium]|nr:glycosyltransferase family 4 protein [Patescibacteria group bacterium]